MVYLLHMITLEYTDDIVRTGITKELASVYEALLKIGETSASALTQALPPSLRLSRPMVYKVLDELILLDLAEKHAPKGKVATFTPKHPVALSKAIDIQKEKIEMAKKQFLPTSGKLSSLFNLMSGKPGVQFYEGKDGVWEVLMDSLTATEEIRTYADLEAIATHIPDLNAEYSTLREERGVKKRGLIIDSPKARDFLKSYDGTVTTTKLITSLRDTKYANTIVQMYDQKVSYITLSENHIIGIIITDAYIADTHKYLFDSMWDLQQGDLL